MGLATPQAGSISFSQLNAGILQAGSTAQLDMNTAGVRMGYGATSQLSISSLRGCLGLTASFTQQAATKYAPAYWASYPNLTYNSAGDFLYEVGEDPFALSNDRASFYGTGFNPAATGWQASSITRIASQGTVRSVVGADASIISWSAGIVDGSASLSFGFKFG